MNRMYILVTTLGIFCVFIPCQNNNTTAGRGAFVKTPASGLCASVDTFSPGTQRKGRRRNYGEGLKLPEIRLEFALNTCIINQILRGGKNERFNKKSS